MIIVNLFAGPGAGKSTTATGVFSRLKIAGINSEYVPEYAKDLTWEGRQTDNQILILGKQFHRIWRLRDQVDVIVTDAPLLLSCIYGADQPESFKQLAVDLHAKFNNRNFFIERFKPYMKVGRNQTADEAKEIDTKVKSLLAQHNQLYQTVPGTVEGIDIVASDIIREIKG